VGASGSSPAFSTCASALMSSKRSHSWYLSASAPLRSAAAASALPGTSRCGIGAGAAAGARLVGAAGGGMFAAVGAAVGATTPPVGPGRASSSSSEWSHSRCALFRSEMTSSLPSTCHSHSDGSQRPPRVPATSSWPPVPRLDISSLSARKFKFRSRALSPWSAPTRGRKNLTTSVSCAQSSGILTSGAGRRG